MIYRNSQISYLYYKFAAIWMKLDKIVGVAWIKSPITLTSQVLSKSEFLIFGLLVSLFETGKANDSKAESWSRLRT